MKFSAELYFKIRSYFTSKLELLQRIERQLKHTDINCQPIHEDNRSLPNEADLKSEFKIFNMGVNAI